MNLRKMAGDFVSKVLKRDSSSGLPEDNEKCWIGDSTLISYLEAFADYVLKSELEEPESSFQCSICDSSFGDTPAFRICPDCWWKTTSERSVVERLARLAGPGKCWIVDHAGQLLNESKARIDALQKHSPLSPLKGGYKTTILEAVEAEEQKRTKQERT